MSPTQEKAPQGVAAPQERHGLSQGRRIGARRRSLDDEAAALAGGALGQHVFQLARGKALQGDLAGRGRRSEEHTSELQSLMRLSYAVVCLKKQIRLTTNQAEC